MRRRLDKEKGRMDEDILDRAYPSDWLAGGVGGFSNLNSTALLERVSPDSPAQAAD
jgi:hypothetical protein